MEKQIGLLKREDIRIRDPFVLLDKGIYYIYGTTDLVDNSLDALNTFAVYKSSDLETFEGPYVIFNGRDNNFWADRDYWAAEVHKYKGKYYLFGSFKSSDHNRATQILVSDKPDGIFKPLTNKPITPSNWNCLDGTFFIYNDKPHIIFSREWVEVGDGELYIAELSSDLKEMVEKPHLLFKASDNKEVSNIKANEHVGKVTDGPYLFKDNNKIKMIWSSFNKNGRYVVLEAVTDDLYGLWNHLPDRFKFDGGHAMVFTSKKGKKYFSLHSPNIPNKERMTFIPYEED